jgi:hypothetical protein
VLGNFPAWRRKVPGGAAGLQNWQARFKKVEKERRFSNKSLFLFLYLIISDFSHFADIDLSRLIFRENWQHGGYMDQPAPMANSSKTLRLFIRRNFSIFICRELSQIAAFCPPSHNNFTTPLPDGFLVLGLEDFSGRTDISLLIQARSQSR